MPLLHLARIKKTQLINFTSNCEQIVNSAVFSLLITRRWSNLVYVVNQAIFTCVILSIHQRYTQCKIE